MSVFRVNRTRDYTTISNHHLRNQNLSLKAKGLLTVMLSLPDDWNYSIGGLVAISLENESAIKSTLNELKKNGYLRVTKLPPSVTESGRFEYVYDVFESPDSEKQSVEKQGVENLPLENLPLENLAVENHPVYKYTNQSSTNNKSTKELSTYDMAKSPNKRFSPPTVDDVKSYCQEQGYPIDPEKFVDYYTSNGWMVGKNHMKDWKAAVRNWARKDNKENNNGERKEERDPTKCADGYDMGKVGIWL